MKKIIFLGSSRKNGETKKVTDALMKFSEYDIIDLSEYQISFFDYEHHNKEDDFISLMKELVEKYDTFLFATPVYWYSMSAIMKVFFDRLTDLLTIEKELGRKLRGKNIAVITSSNGNNLGDKFWLPFTETAEYLGMNYLSNIHTIAGQLNLTELKNFDIELSEE